MIETLPGTTLSFTGAPKGNYLASFEPLIDAGNGLAISQVASMAGIEISTIQNWVKRGWVANPIHKRYQMQQIVRIFLINMLRPVLQIDTIIQLLSFVNGKVEDTSDDIIPDLDLYNLLCGVIAGADVAGLADETALQRIVESVAQAYEEPFPGAKERLFGALQAMALACVAARLKCRAQAKCETLLSEKQEETQQ